MSEGKTWQGYFSEFSSNLHENLIKVHEEMESKRKTRLKTVQESSITSGTKYELYDND